MQCHESFYSASSIINTPPSPFVKFWLLTQPLFSLALGVFIVVMLCVIAAILLRRRFCARPQLSPQLDRPHEATDHITYGRLACSALDWRDNRGLPFNRWNRLAFIHRFPRHRPSAFVSPEIQLSDQNPSPTTPVSL